MGENLDSLGSSFVGAGHTVLGTDVVLARYVGIPGQEHVGQISTLAGLVQGKCCDIDVSLGNGKVKDAIARSDLYGYSHILTVLSGSGGGSEGQGEVLERHDD